MVRSYSRLTQSLIVQYGNRKQPGRLSIFVNVEDEQIYCVPRNEEHIDFAARIVCNSDYSSKRYAKLIPSHISVERNYQTLEDEVVGVLTGVSGLEIGAGVRHSKSDLQEAHNLAKKFCFKGDLQCKLRDDKIQYRYSCD